MRYGVKSVGFLILFLLASWVWGAQVLSVEGFEKSAFAGKYNIVDKQSWALRSGGKNHLYKFEKGEGARVELTGDPMNIKMVAVLWMGKSTLEPAQLTATKASFLGDLLKLVDSDAEANKVIAHVKVQQKQNFQDGSNAMPRRKFGALSIFAGVTGSELIVGIEK